MSPGLANTPQVIFPMNRSMALVLELEHNKETVFEMIERLQSVYWVAGNKQQADQINHLIVLNSRDKIFGHPSDSERLLKLSELLEPISNWKTSSDWSEATQRLLALKETVVNLFRDTSRDDIARMLAKSQSSGGSSDSFFQDF